MRERGGMPSARDLVHRRTGHMLGQVPRAGDEPWPGLRSVQYQHRNGDRIEHGRVPRRRTLVLPGLLEEGEQVRDVASCGFEVPGLVGDRDLLVVEGPVGGERPQRAGQVSIGRKLTRAGEGGADGRSLLLVEQVLTNAQRPVEEWVDEVVPTAFARPVPPQSRDDFVTMMLDARPAGSVPMPRGFAEADLRDVLSAVRVPVLLLDGDADLRSPLRVAEESDAALPQSRLVVLPGIGNASNLEAPETFNDEVRTFVQSAAPTGTGSR